MFNFAKVKAQCPKLGAASLLFSVNVDFLVYGSNYSEMPVFELTPP